MTTIQAREELIKTDPERIYCVNESTWYGTNQDYTRTEFSITYFSKDGNTCETTGTHLSLEKALALAIEEIKRLNTIIPPLAITCNQ